MHTRKNIVESIQKCTYAKLRTRVEHSFLKQQTIVRVSEVRVLFLLFAKVYCYQKKGKLVFTSRLMSVAEARKDGS